MNNKQQTLTEQIQTQRNDITKVKMRTVHTIPVYPPTFCISPRGMLTGLKEKQASIKYRPAEQVKHCDT